MPGASTPPVPDSDKSAESLPPKSAAAAGTDAKKAAPGSKDTAPTPGDPEDPEDSEELEDEVRAYRDG